MPRTLSERALGSINDEQTEEVWLVLVTIDHPDLAIPIRVVNNYENITSNGHEYIGLPFDIQLPGEGPDDPGSARLSVDNVDRMIVDTIRTIQSPPTVRIQVVLASQPDIIEYSLANLTMRDVSYDAATVSGTLRFEDLSIEPVAELITPQRFPGLFTVLWALLSLAALLHAGPQWL